MQTVRRLKWLAFRGLEQASIVKDGLKSSLGNKGHSEASESARVSLRPPSISDAPPLYWFFVSTIGELNAIRPLLQQLLDEQPLADLLFISDHEHYREPYLRQYPRAEFVSTTGLSADLRYLFARRMPSSLVVAEIPARLSDAPCRFPYAALHYAKQHKVPLALVNGWLYGGGPSCAIDNLERRFFDRDYAELFDLSLVQTKEVESELLEQGAVNVHITGNMKFDQALVWANQQHTLAGIPAELAADRAPLIVVGSVSEAVDQKKLLQALISLRSQQPNARMVIAPRHPEFPERMAKLRGVLEESGLRFCFRTELAVSDDANASNIDWDVMALNTVGELAGYYAAADIAHVGVDHNVLEPLALGKPVTIDPGWEPKYPSYPVYDQLRDFPFLMECDGDVALAEQWTDWLANNQSSHAVGESVVESLSEFAGALDRNWALLKQAGFFAVPAAAKSS